MARDTNLRISTTSLGGEAFRLLSVDAPRRWTKEQVEEGLSRPRSVYRWGVSSYDPVARLEKSRRWWAGAIRTRQQFLDEDVALASRLAEQSVPTPAKDAHIELQLANTHRQRDAAFAAMAAHLAAHGIAAEHARAIEFYQSRMAQCGKAE
jgi:hypothetical protein